VYAESAVKILYVKNVKPLSPGNPNSCPRRSPFRLCFSIPRVSYLCAFSRGLRLFCALSSSFLFFCFSGRADTSSGGLRYVLYCCAVLVGLLLQCSLFGFSISRVLLVMLSSFFLFWVLLGFFFC